MSDENDEFELYATKTRFEQTASGALDFVVTTRKVPPEAGDIIKYYEVDSGQKVKGSIKTGRVAFLTITHVELVTPPWYVLGVCVRGFMKNFREVN